MITVLPRWFGLGHEPVKLPNWGSWIMRLYELTDFERGAVLALNGSAAAELYCGKSRRAGKSRPMRRESAGYRITSLCPSGTVRKRDGTPRGGQQRDTAPSPPVIVLGRTLSGARLR